MLGRTVDRLEARLAPHARLISIAAAIWFWLGIAIQARFIPLPEMPRPLESAIFWAGIAGNAVWWGYLRPRIAKRGEQRALAER